MGRSTRSPQYDLQRHIITGERGPLSGTPGSIVQDQDDAMIDHEDPMQFGAGSGVFGSQDSATIIAANNGEATGLASAAGPGGSPIDMGGAGDNSDPAKGGSDYGPRNTGGR